MLKRKGFILAMAFAGIFCLLCYLFLPGFILSFTDRNIIKKQLIQAVEAAYPVRLRLGDIRYAWGKFELTDVALTSLDGRPLAEIPLMGVELNWFKLAFNPGNLFLPCKSWCFMSQGWSLKKPMAVITYKTFLRPVKTEFPWRGRI